MPASHGENPVRAIEDEGYCVLRGALPQSIVERTRCAFWPRLLQYLADHRGDANRGPRRHYFPMPFEEPIFAPEFFCNTGVLAVVRALMGDRIVADQWGCDVAEPGSEFQDRHIDFRRPLFEEAPELPLPPYMLCVSFGLAPITVESGAIEIQGHAIPLDPGDVLIRRPWAPHRGTPNRTDTPRPLLSIRYVRTWYTDGSRPVNPIPVAVWKSLSPSQRGLLRFPLE